MRHFKFKIMGDVEGQFEFVMDICNLMISDEPLTKKDKVTILYDTPGGCFTTGTKIIEALKLLQKRTQVVIINCGHVASMGCAIFLSVRERYMMPWASFMLHHARLYDVGTLSEKEAREADKDLNKSNKLLAKMTIKKLKLTKAQLAVYNKGDDLILDFQAAEKAGVAKLLRDR